MIDILLVIFSIIFLTSLGYFIIQGFSLLHKSDKLFILACSYGLGVGLSALQLYFYSRFSISWNITFVLFPWIIFMVIMIAIKRQQFLFLRPKLPKVQLFDWILLFFIGIMGGFVIFESLLHPVSVWDGVVIWMNKSQIFFMDKTIRPEVINNLLDPGYPLIISLFGTWIYIILGHVNDTAVLLTSAAFYLFLALLLFTALRKRFGITYALLFTFLLVSMQNFIRHGGRMEAGQADLALGYFAFISFLLLWEYIKRFHKKTLLLLSVFLGFTTLIKSEGLPYAIVIGTLVVYYIWKNKLYTHFPLLFFWIFLTIDWDIYKRINNAAVNYFSVHTPMLSLSKAVNAIWGTGKELLNIKSWNMLWILYFFSFILYGFKRNKELILLNIVILSQIALYLFLYIFTLNNDPQSSIQRLLLHIAPLVLYYLAIVTWFIRNKKDEK